jgi:predicted GNAT family N-acyltransferase
MQLQIKPLEKNQNKVGFSCGHVLLDDYIKKQAKQDVSRNLSACFVLVDHENTVKGYYTLSSNSIRKDEFSKELAKKLPPSYFDIPTILLGRLAIDQSIKGQRWGEIILMDALNRSLHISTSLGTMAIIVDPVDDIARKFYSKYGFIHLPGSGKMFIPLKTIEGLIL